MRIQRAWIAVVLSAVPCVWAQGQNTENKVAQANEAKKGLPPRATPGDYQAHMQVGKLTLAAEFTGHSVTRPEGPLTSEDYVVVEAGLFGPPGEHLQISGDDFSLRINGKKTALASQPFELVAKTLKDPSWSPPETEDSKKSKSSFSTGGGGDNTPPPPVHVPIELRRAMAQYVQRGSMPEGDRSIPLAGLLFFEYRGKVQGIHSMELIYAGAAGKATLALQP